MTMKNLQNQWQRHDWQHNPFAPSLRIVQALVKGKTASGAGFTRYDAISRCLGETAEILVLKAGEHSEGLAAGPDYAFAAAGALQERLERWALWEWWHGKLKAEPVEASALVKPLREGAQERRETQVWLLPGFSYTYVAIAKSQSMTGAKPLLGFGANACPKTAAQSALIELGLMELNLLSPRADLPAYFERLAAQFTTLFPPNDSGNIALTSLNTKDKAEAALAQANIKCTLQNLTPEGADLSVVRAVLPDAPSWGHTASPLL
jgi:ribosomal protein S12 methylthiotransferase accessory factor YcaO